MEAIEIIGLGIRQQYLARRRLTFAGFSTVASFHKVKNESWPKQNGQAFRRRWERWWSQFKTSFPQKCFKPFAECARLHRQGVIEDRQRGLC
jgi:hypothetical protein